MGRGHSKHKGPEAETNEVPLRDCKVANRINVDAEESAKREGWSPSGASLCGIYTGP